LEGHCICVLTRDSLSRFLIASAILLLFVWLRALWAKHVLTGQDGGHNEDFISFAAVGELGGEEAL
jgi:hypothetical protein